MDTIVLVKHVADVEKIPEDAWDRDRGTLRRHLLQMVANPLDDRALELGLRIARNGGGRLVVLSMGPPQAEEVCRRAIAYGADRAILLSDGAFAGADTIATARTLAAAIERIVREGIVDAPLVIAGMQSPDGDTAQVPVQVAAFLRYPLVPYVTAWGRAGESRGLTFETLRSRGRSTVALNAPPAVLTTTSFAPELPFYTTLERIGTAAEAEVLRWDRTDLGLDERQIGLAGSLTRVVRIFAPEKRDRAGYRVDFGGETDPLQELPIVLEELREYLTSGGASMAGEGRPAGDERPAGYDQPEGSDRPVDHEQPKDGDRLPGHDQRENHGESQPFSAASSFYRGECLVLCERSGGITPGSRELLGASASLAEELGTTTIALVPGTVSDDELADLARAGADRVVAMPGVDPDRLRPEEYARAIIDLVRRTGPQILLVPATLTGRVIAPLVAAQLGAGLTADCTGLRIDDHVGRAGGRETVYRKVLFQTRPALGGNVMATIVSLRGRENNTPQIATARPGVFSEIDRGDAVAELDVFEPGTVTPRIAITEIAAGDHTTVDQPVSTEGDGTAGEDVPLDECDVIVSVGLGIGGVENVDTLARPLVRALERAWGVTVGLGCSRAAMEAGYLPYARQVGQTGKTVKPRVYIALGISGAVQHRVGMEGAGRILSINSDTEAPLFSHSDYVIRASCREAVPVLLKLLEG